MPLVALGIVVSRSKPTRFDVASAAGPVVGVTLIVVEHNDDVIRAADWCLTVGPGAADEGGNLVYEGVPRERN